MMMFKGHCHMNSCTSVAGGVGTICSELWLRCSTSVLESGHSYVLQPAERNDFWWRHNYLLAECIATSLFQRISCILHHSIHCQKKKLAQLYWKWNSIWSVLWKVFLLFPPCRSYEEPMSVTIMAKHCQHIYSQKYPNLSVALKAFETCWLAYCTISFSR